MGGISALTDLDTVRNTVVFIADSLRFDHLSPSVSNLGVTAQAISPSTYTATSIPAMMTGRYPAKNRVWNFDDTLAEAPELFRYPNTGMDLRNIWTNIDEPAKKPPNRVLRLNEQATIEDAEEPFTVVIHEKGAHAPYNSFDAEWETSPAYFERFAGQNQKLQEEYKKGANAAANRFLTVIDELKDRGLFDETLIIFTSDHGELLGEQERGGLYAHGSPVCPELVKVPLVFLGCGLPEGKTYDKIVSGADIAPTLLGAQERAVPEAVDGIDLWHTDPNHDRVVRSDFWANAGRIKYGASSAWDRNGGVVHHHGSMLERMIFAAHRKLYKGAQAPANRNALPQSLWRLLLIYGEQEVVYGSPDLETVRSVTVSSLEPGKNETTVEPASKEKLRALGYLE